VAASDFKQLNDHYAERSSPRTGAPPASISPFAPPRPRSFCGPFSRPLRSICGPQTNEQPRTRANTVPRTPAFSGLFAHVRPYSRFSNQSGRPDSNRGPRRPERRALPGCATPRRASSIPHARPGHPDGHGTPAPPAPPRRPARSPRSGDPPSPPPGKVARVPTATAEIIAELDSLLEPERFEDYCVNGLQVPGPQHIETIATGVSANVALFERAAQEHARLLLVHHGLFWGSGVQTIDAMLKRRLELLFDADMALAAYHLPLDAHPQLGNNALLARALGATDLAPFALHHGQPIGFLATLSGAVEGSGGAGDDGTGSDDPDGDAAPGGPTATDEGLQAEDLFARVQAVTARAPLVLGAGPARVRRLAIVSGAGSDYLAEAAAAGADALLTGEPAERATANARELGMYLVAAGHHATETFGVKRLGEHLAERFGLRHVFLDVPNPV
jgi:dinuclear metal center YbgI/SA1388 family protein